MPVKKKTKKAALQKQKHDATTASSFERSVQSDVIDDKDLYLSVDPLLVRFQHSRIRPYFSGCGRSVQSTLQQIRDGVLSPEDLPPILVMPLESLSCNISQQKDVSMDDISKVEIREGENGKGKRRRTKSLQRSKKQAVALQQEYVSLNNRRLWVLKECRREGLLMPFDNQIRARVRHPRSVQERARYSLQNCSLEAKFMREAQPSTSATTKSKIPMKGEENSLCQKEPETKTAKKAESPKIKPGASDEEEEETLSRGELSETEDYDGEEMVSTSSNLGGFSALLSLDDDEESSSDSCGNEPI